MTKAAHVAIGLPEGCRASSGGWESPVLEGGIGHRLACGLHNELYSQLVNFGTLVTELWAGLVIADP